jgi:hypothetical protein
LNTKPELLGEFMRHLTKPGDETVVLVACVLGGVLFMKGLGAYYDFNWTTALAAQ